MLIISSILNQYIREQILKLMIENRYKSDLSATKKNIFKKHGTDK